MHRDKNLSWGKPVLSKTEVSKDWLRFFICPHENKKSLYVSVNNEVVFICPFIELGSFFQTPLRILTLTFSLHAASSQFIMNYSCQGILFSGNFVLLRSDLWTIFSSRQIIPEIDGITRKLQKLPVMHWEGPISCILHGNSIE